VERRNIFRAAFAAAVGAWAVSRDGRAAKAATPSVSKVVYHLADFDKVTFVMGNIRNHFSGMGGPDKVTIALVVHGPALKAFHAQDASPEVASDISTFTKAGMELAACANTMRGQKVTLADLLPGFVTAEKGGVVRLAELQAQGYVYLRP
jgi:intracellular sulfur oxidation DsrE/DsrF family protein